MTISESAKHSTDQGVSQHNEKLAQEAEKIIRSIAIPTKPHILIQLNQEVGKTEPEYKAIAELVSQDISLTAKVLKIANSSFFSLPQRVRSINMALSVLGLDQFNSIVLTSAFRDAMRVSHMPPDELEMFYGNAMLTARACQWIVQTIFDLQNYISLNQAYMMGLFHNCGMPMLALKFRNYYAQVRGVVTDTVSLIDVEDEFYKTNHALVGSFLAKAWDLPEAIYESIAYHHDPRAVENDDEGVKHRAALLITAQLAVHESMANENELAGIYEYHMPDDESLDVLLNTLEISREQMEQLKDAIKEWMD
jgi:HD-like signal output (HDOD) protein